MKPIALDLTVRRSLIVYECEHDGDLDHACDELQRLGATFVTVRSRDYEGEECVCIEYTPPLGLTNTQWRTKLATADLCL